MPHISDYPQVRFVAELQGQEVRPENRLDSLGDEDRVGKVGGIDPVQTKVVFNWNEGRNVFHGINQLGREVDQGRLGLFGETSNERLS